MKIISLISILVLISSIKTLAQNYSRTFVISGNLYKVVIDNQDDESKKIDLLDASGASIKSFTLKPYSFTQFENTLAPAIKAHRGLNTNSPEPSIDAEVRLLFIDSVAKLYESGDDEGPIAGSLTVRPKINVYTKENLRTNLLSVKNYENFEEYLVQDVEIEVLEGFIENIIVTALNPKNNHVITFCNSFGIGFASKNNMSNLYRYWLPEKNVNISNKDTKYIQLGGLNGLIDFKQKSAPGRRDYSPKDDRYTFALNGSEVKFDLRKDITKRLIEARVYSDFVGLDQDKPNGLIQTEIAKRINTNTNRIPIFKNKIFTPVRFILGEGGGIFQYVIPSITLSKLEENNRRLVLHRNGDEIGTSDVTLKIPNFNNKGEQIGQKDTTFQIASIIERPYVTPLELIRYQAFSAGLDFNLLYSENIGGKFNFYLDGGIRFGRTLLRDSLTKISTVENAFGGKDDVIVKSDLFNDFGVNTIQLYPELKMQWMPDERFGVTLSKRWTYLRLLNGELEQKDISQADYDYASKAVLSNPSLSNYDSNQWLGIWELSAFLKPSENGKLFFRYRLFNELKKPQYNFHQIQVGYSFYILGNQKVGQGSGGSN